MKEEIRNLFQAYVMDAFDPGDFYGMPEETWKEMFPEIEEFYSENETDCPFTLEDIPMIKKEIEKLLEEEFPFLREE